MKTKPRQISGSGANWLPGAMAVAAATATTQAATVQISLTNNYIGGSGWFNDLSAFGDHLSAGIKPLDLLATTSERSPNLQPQSGVGCRLYKRTYRQGELSDKGSSVEWEYENRERERPEWPVFGGIAAAA